jgi:DAK2 domain fusion protein YloV
MARKAKVPPTKPALTGADLRAMFAGAVTLLEGNAEQINALNVFPVPDGDTGTNMFLTLREVAKAASAASNGSASDVAKVMAASALREARGNSGVILSQFFKGIAEGLDGKAEFGPNDLADALQRAKDYSYKAVGKPVEGTMLTVIRRVAEVAQGDAASCATVLELLTKACAVAKEAVEATPSMLPVLKQAGVVDAGGQGLYIILEGARRVLAGEPIIAETLPVAGVNGAVGGAVVISREFLAAAEHELYGYCTQLLITGEGLDTEAIRSKVMAMARSVVVVGDGEAVKVHGHTEDPGAVLSFAASMGQLSQISVANMDDQRRGFSAMHRSKQQAAKAIALVAVASGDGLRRLFESLGADVVVDGGDTMNPSVRQLLEAIESCPPQRVIVLPNNKNIVPTAVQATGMVKKSARTVASTTIPQGIAAALNYSQEKEFAACVSDMQAALGTVKTVRVTEATRSVAINGLDVKKGQAIGLVEDEVVVTGEEPGAVLRAALQKTGLDAGQLVTLYWGEGLDEAAARSDFKMLKEAFPDAEFELVNGGQPHYLYIASIE